MISGLFPQFNAATSRVNVITPNLSNVQMTVIDVPNIWEFTVKPH